jgi:VWFA-related protein
MGILIIDARIGAALFLCCAVSGFPQTDQSPEVASHDTPVTFSSKVSLVMAPVVVRDKKGRAIGTLRKEDFQLFDKGKPQIISTFTIEKADGRVEPREVTAVEPASGEAVEKAPAGPPPASRFVAYMFDDMHTNAGDLAAAREAAIEYLNRSLQPADRAAIYTTSGQTTLDFTDDKGKLRETVNRIVPRSRTTKLTKPCPDISDYMADLIFNKGDDGR